MATHAEMRERPAPIFVTDVAFADIARHDDDFHRRVERASLAPAHECNYQFAIWGGRAADPNGG
jgi:hypothetical protein